MRLPVVFVGALAVILACVSSNTVEYGFFRVNSPVAKPGSATDSTLLTMASALTHTYSSVFGVSSTVSVYGNAASAALPVTEAFTRPQAGLIVAAPGLSHDDAAVALSGSTAVQVDTRAALGVDEASWNACEATTVIVGEGVNTMARWSDKIGAFEVLGSGKASGVVKDGVAFANSPCSSAVAWSIPTAAVAASDATGVCTLTLSNGASLAMTDAASSRIASEAALLLYLTSNVVSPSSGACPALIHAEFQGAKTASAAASSFFARAVALASDTLSTRFPSRTATALFTTSIAAEHGRRLQASVTPTPSPSPPPTARDIAIYQIVLWVAIVLVLALGAAVGSLVFMDLGRDPVLYNQFKTDDSKRD